MCVGPMRSRHLATGLLLLLSSEDDVMEGLEAMIIGMTGPEVMWINSRG